MTDPFATTTTNPTTNNIQHYFPELPKKEILECLAELGIELEMEELNEPHRHKERIRSIFTTLVQHGLAKDATYFQSIPTQLSSPETKKEILKAHYPYSQDLLREDSYLQLKLFMSCRRFMTICGLEQEFGLRDFYAPTHKRLRTQLSAMINYFKFLEGKSGSYEEVTQSQTELLQELHVMTVEYEQLQQQQKQVREQTQVRLQERQEMEQKCQQYETEIGKMNKIQSALRLESTELKKKSNELKDQLAMATLQLQELQSEEKKLTSQIVKSPEKIKQRMEDLEKDLEMEQKLSTEAEHQATVSKVHLARVTQAVQDGVAAIKLMEAVQMEQERLKEPLINLYNIQQEILKNDEMSNRLKEQIEVNEREVRILEDKINHNRKQFKTKMDAAQHSSEAAKSELFLVEKDRRDAMARVEVVELEVRSLEAIIQEEKAKNEAEIQEIFDNFKQLESVIMEKDKEFLSTIHKID